MRKRIKEKCFEYVDLMIRKRNINIGNFVLLILDIGIAFFLLKQRFVKK